MAPENAKMPIATAIVFHPYCLDSKPANTGPKSVAAAIEQLNNAKA